MIHQKKIWMLNIFLLLSLLLAGCTTTDIFEGSMITGAAIGVNEPIGMFANPVVDTAVLNTTKPALNNSNQNITAYTTTSDGDADPVKVIYNWLLNGSSTTYMNIPFEADEGQNTTDFSGYGRISTVANAVWAPAGGHDNEGAYTFDGSTSYINTSDFDVGDNFSISLWANLDATTNGQAFISKHDGSGGNIFILGIYSGGYQVRIRDQTYTGGTVKTGWQHLTVVGTEDGSSTDVELFSNGTSLWSNTHASEMGDTTGFPWVIGQEWDGVAPSDFLGGEIDEVIIWNRSLTASQVFALYQNNSGTISSSETTSGQNWTVDATPTDGTNNGTTVRSNQVIVTDLTNRIPTVDTLVLNSTNLLNKTSENLTVYATTSDLDNDQVKVIYNWLQDGTSITVVNMPFEADEGQNTTDFSGYDNDAVVTGAVWSDAGGYDSNGVYDFEADNTADHINISLNTDTISDITVAYWLYPESLSGATIPVHFPNSAGENEFGLFVQTDGSVDPWLNHVDQDTYAAGTIVAGRWQHVVATYDSSTVKLYIDGKLNASTSVSLTLDFDNCPVLVGTDPDAAGDNCDGTLGNWWDGKVDELMIFNRTLTAEQISALFNNRTDLIVSQELSANQNWTVDATPIDGTNNGTTVRSNQVIVLSSNSLPVVDTLVLNSTDLSNDTNQNVTAYATTSDGNGDGVKVMYNWLVNDSSSPGPGKSITILNMPFERINGTNTDNAWDYSGYEHDGSESGATWNATGGHDGNASYEFDGSNDIITIARNDTLQPNSSITVSLWLKRNGAQQSWAKPLWYGPNDNSPWGAYGFQFNNADDNIINWHIADTGSEANPSTGAIINDATWYHLVGRYNGSHAAVFVDGTQIAASAHATGIADYDATNGLAIGDKFETANRFKGTIDDVIIFNKSLSLEQIQAIFTNRTDLIVSQELSANQNWTVDATPNDGTEDGAVVRSNQLITLEDATNSVPTIDTLILNSTDLSNDTNQNITVYATTSDNDSDSVKVIYNWMVNDSSSPGPGKSITLLNMPFERINGTDSDNAWDYSGNGNNGTEFASPIWNSTGGIGGSGAYEFDGTDDQRIAVRDSESLDFANGKTYTFWFKRSSSTANQHLIGKAKPETPYSGCVFRYDRASDDKVNIKCITDGGTTDVDLTSSTAISDSNWHFIAVDIDTTLTLYQDGVSVGTDTSHASSYTSGTNFSVGEQGWDWAGQPTDGTVDDVMIFNRSLSLEQIQAIFNNQTDLIVSQETTTGQNWTVDATPNDGTSDGASVRSNQLITTDLTNSLPSVDILVLNSTDLSNYTNQNLTVYATTTDGDDDSVKNTLVWNLNGTPQLLLYLPFEPSGNLNATDYAGSNNSATSVSGGTNAQYLGNTGYNNSGAWNFTGSNAHLILNYSNFPTIGTDDYTVEAWIKSNSSDTYQTIIGYRGFDPSFHIQPGKMFVYDGAELNSQTGLDVTNGNWHHVAYVRNSSASNNLQFYLDGARVGVVTHTDSLAAPTSLFVGYDGFGGEDFRGTIDELKWWNRSLTQQQIQAIFNNQTNIIVSQETTINQNWTVDVTPNDGIEDGSTVRSNQVITIDSTDTTVPEVTWITGENINYSLTTFNQTFNVSVFEENNDSVIFVFNNATGNDFNISAFNESGHWTRSVNVSGLVEGNHIVTAYVNDTYGNSNNTENLSFTVDFTPPTITWVNPTNVSNYTVSTGNVSFNITVNDLTVQTVLFSFDNATGNNFNVTGINDSGTWYANVNVSGLTEGTTVVTVIANDSVGQINNTEQLTIIVDNIAPTITWVNPNNNSNYSLSSGNVSFNITLNEANFVHNLIFNFDNGTGTAFNVTGINDSGTWYTNVNVSGLTEGLNTVTIFANDSVGNVNSTEKIYFTSDFTAPVVDHINTNVSNYTTASGNVTFNVSIKDLTPYAVVFVFDNASGTSFNQTPGNFSGYWNITLDITSLEEGTHTMKVHANDSVGNENNSQEITFIVDNIAPTVTWVNPNNNSNYSLSYGNVSFNITVNEVNFVHNLTFSFDNGTGNSFNVTGINDSGTWYTNVNVSGLTEGLNTVTVFANDSIGNVNSTEKIYFTSDFTAPIVTWVNPTNVSNYTVSTGNVSFNITVNDLTVQTVLFSFDNASGNNFNVTGINDSGTWYANVNVSGLTEGTTVVTVIANDSIGQINNTEQLTIIVDNLAPTVTWVNPNNNSNYSLSYGNVSFNITINEANFVHNLTFSFDNGTGTSFNVTGINDSGAWYTNVNVSGLTEGLNTVTIFANDSIGNVNSTEKIYFTSDFTAPFVNITSPINGSNFNLSSGNYAFNVTIKDLTVQSVLFSFTNSTGNPFNITATNNSGYWLASVNVSGLENGSQSVTALVNDSVGYYNWTTNITILFNNITNPVESSSSSSSSSSGGGSSSSESGGGGSLPPKKEEKKEEITKEPIEKEVVKDAEKEVEEKGEVSKSQKPQGFVGFAILPDNVSDLINYGSLAGIVALIISLISAVPVIARKRKMGTPNWFESMIDEEIENIFVPQDYSLMPIIRRTKFIPHRNNLAWLESWVGTMKNSGFSESKIITVAKHHPRITEPQIQTVLERINSSNLLQQQYGLDKVSIKELQQYVLSKSKKPEIVMKELIAAGWDRKTIQPFIDAYTNLGKGKRIHKVYAISYAVALKRLKISYELSEMELNALKEFIETEQVNSKSVEQITSILVNQGWSKKDIHPFVKSYVRVSPHRNS